MLQFTNLVTDQPRIDLCDTRSMPKRSRKVQKKKSAQDENESAFDAIRRILELTEGTEGKNPLAVALGHSGGLKGGKARAEKMTPKQRRRSATKAAKARWERKKA